MTFSDRRQPNPQVKEHVRIRDTVRIGPTCGGQFHTVPLIMRVTGIHAYLGTYPHMVYLSGPTCRAGEKFFEYRDEVLVEYAGIQVLERPAPVVVTRRSNAGPARIPQQRSRTTHRSNR